LDTKRLLLIVFLLTVGILVMVEGVAASFGVTFLTGLALSLLGAIFWLQAE
jgi:hypothetical protein